MKGTGKNLNPAEKQTDLSPDDNLPGYPVYPPGEDIYSRSHKESNIDPEDITTPKAPKLKGKAGDLNEKDFLTDISGSDLDIPGSELDDSMEEIGSEDEENNYYSIGGDNHNDLDENRNE